ncbi:hypothetical protein [Rhodoferax sp.]|uniref:hypothetical protein n=1 Tax=Rhodoferax sp. TaxID=50421 RepID=UPI00262C5D80|nr:hypothetical protein [Rhodoferax sp.]MDD3938094.1 hypothetical protein [Rhodoferax sp.]
MTTIFIKDDLRASVEAASGGKQTVLYTASGQPTYMNIIPKFNGQDVDAGLPAGVHPAFIVNGVEKSELFIGTYPGIVKNNELLSLPGVDCSTLINHDTAVTRARECGAGFHVMSNVEFAAMALWCRANSFEPRGNTNYGRAHDAVWETGRRVDGLAPGTTSGSARILTGSGPVSWRHDNSSSGISDLAGNVWEWTPGMRVDMGEIQIIPNNDAALNATDFGVASADWKAINGATGALVAPGSANSVKYAVSGTTPYTLVRASGQSFEGMTNPGTTPVGATALALLKAHGLFPVASLLGGTIALPAANGDGFYIDATIEALPIRGGNWSYAAAAGVFTLNCNYTRTYGFNYLGARPAFVL